METKKNIREILVDDDNFLFYKMMNYPIPTNKDFFSLDKRDTIEESKINFSWTQKSPILKKYISFINKFGRLYRSLPFINNIYLCNSISFNAINENSDIDIFIVTKKNCLRRARFFSRIFFTMFFIKRSKKNKKRKFCLSFYTTIDNTNLYNISLPKSDIYLAYRLAHLVPLYQEVKYNIYSENNRLLSYLPNFPQNHIINVGTKRFTGKSNTKVFIERFFGGYFGKSFEYLIKSIRLPIVIHKKNNLKEKGRGIIVNDKMLKFHQDIRKKIYIIFKSHKAKTNIHH